MSQAIPQELYSKDKMGPLHQQRRSSRKSMCGRYRNIISKKSTTMARPRVQNGR